MASDFLVEEKVSSRQVLDGVLLKAHRDEVRLPDGTTGVREWIEHPGASAIVPLFPNGDTLLVRQFRYSTGREFLEVPAGKLDLDDDDPAEIAAMELEEETGWKAGKLVHIGSAHPCIGYSNEVIHFYLAEDLSQGKRDLDDGEFLELMRVPFSEAVEKARSGELADMKTVTALVYAANALDHR